MRLSELSRTWARSSSATCRRPQPRADRLGRRLRRALRPGDGRRGPRGYCAVWRKAHLTVTELARLTIRAAQPSATVTLPDGTTKPLSAGPSQPIIKGIIEQFAPRFLNEPTVLSYSDSAAPVAYVDPRLMQRIGLQYGAGDPLPDVLLADIAQPLRFVSVEAVATEGPADPGRVAEVTAWVTRSGFSSDDLYFVTAYLDRGQAAFRKTVGEVAWRSALWFVAEPDCPSWLWTADR